MDPCIRKLTLPSKIPSNYKIKQNNSSEEKTLLVTSLALSPKEFAQQIFKEEERNLTAAHAYDTLCTSLLTDSVEMVDLISPIHSPVIEKKDLEVSDTDSEQTKLELKKSYLKSQSKTKKAAKTPCGYIIKKGNRKGQSCNLLSSNESKLCSIHRPTRSLAKSSSDLEKRVEYLEKKVKGLNQLLTRWMSKKPTKTLKLKNVYFTNLKKLSKSENYHFMAFQQPNKVTLKRENKTYMLKLPKSLIKVDLTKENYLKFSQNSNQFKWY